LKVRIRRFRAHCRMVLHEWMLGLSKLF